MERKTYRNDRGQRIKELHYQPKVIFTRDPVDLYQINQPVYLEDNSERYTLAAIDFLGRGHGCIARLTLIPEIAAD